MRGTPKTPNLLPVSPENYPDRVPDFTSEAEEQEFWATHASSPYFDQGELVFTGEADRASGDLPRDARLLITVSVQTMAGLESRSREIGESVEEMIREWVEDRLHTESRIFGDVGREATA